MEKGERNSGIELLRIVAMFAVIILHVLGKGGVLAASDQLSSGYELAWLMELLCYFGVTVYALITGYTCIEGRYHLTNIIYLWLQVFFYNFIATVGFYIFDRDVVSLENIKQLFFPVMTESFWYFSAYFGAFFFIPVIKLCFEKMDKIFLDVIFGFILTAWSVFQVFFNYIDVFSLRHGASFLWIVASIFIGAYMKKNRLLEKYQSSTLWLVYALMVFVTWSVKFIIEFIYGYELWNRDRGNVLVAYNSPTILISAMALLVIFSRYNIKGKAAKVVFVLSPLTFGVYLSNSQMLVFENLMKDRFASYASLPLLREAACVVLTAIVIFLIGIAIDALRKCIFELIGIRQRLHAFEDYARKNAVN